MPPEEYDYKLLLATWLFLLFLQFDQIGIQPIERSFPELAIVFNPIRDLAQSFGL